MAGLKVLIGAFLLVAGAIITLPFPEFGISLVLVGLRLLGERFVWARRANKWLDAKWSSLRIRFHRLPTIARVAVIAALAAVAAALVLLLASHL